MKKLKYCLLAILCPALCWSQPMVKPLSIGDTIPDIALERIMNNAGNYTHVSDMQGKLLIIDFWASWCTACLKGFGKLATLKDQYGNDLQVLLVNSANSRDDENRVKAVLEKRKKLDGRPVPFPTLVKDTIFDHLFPHTLLPHYVWVADGVIRAITNSDELSTANIARAMQGDFAGITIKKEQDADRPLFTTTDLPREDLLQYSILAKGKFPGLGSGNRLRRSGKMVYGRAITNASLLFIYRATGQELIKDFSDKRMLVNVRDTTLLKPPANKDLYEEWQKENLYNYDIILPPWQADQLYRYMLEDLNRSSGLKGSIENRLSTVWVLSATNAMKNEPPATGPMQNRLSDSVNPCMQNCAVSILMRWLDHFKFLRIPMVDETGINHAINICLPAGINNIKTLQHGLEECGLKLTCEQRRIPMLVITQPPAGISKSEMQ